MTRHDMGKEALKAKRSAVINQLQQLHKVLSSVKTPNFGIDELCELGLKAVRLTSLFLDHPLIEEECVSDLEGDRDSPLFSDESFEEYPTEDSEEEAWEEEASSLDVVFQSIANGWREKLADLQEHIETCAEAPRYEIHAPNGPGSLRDLTPLRSSRSYGNWLPSVIFFVGSIPEDLVGDGRWFATHSYLDKSGGTPHVIIQLEVRYRANDTSLTHGEVCGLVGRMCQWYSLQQFQQHAMCPEGQTFERTTDEQYVNQALMAFLDAVALNILNNKWGDEAFAIVETKAHSGKDGAKTSKSTCKNPPRWSLGYAGMRAQDAKCPLTTSDCLPPRPQQPPPAKARPPPAQPASAVVINVYNGGVVDYSSSAGAVPTPANPPTAKKRRGRGKKPKKGKEDGQN
ncbi:hypothetical protein CNMCM5623_007096 [Aspergillus felis]|uniref:Uncharacterized protein n=1 Tax=Aspergillus felis TaxID=1287682 RepID=A0A8H6QM72_9EURO|nr:hypothetical protein CNMCM5623_007096 [Aspergillus felis]